MKRLPLVLVLLAAAVSAAAEKDGQTTPAAPDQQADVSALRESCEESNLPFRVDLFVWDEVPEPFRKNIEAERVVILEDT